MTELLGLHQPAGGGDVHRDRARRDPAGRQGRARRLRLLEAGRRGRGLLHRGRRSLQLPGRLVHPRHRAAARAGARSSRTWWARWWACSTSGWKRWARCRAATAPFRVAVYAPLAETPAPPDVVLVRGRARQIMLVAEAARAAGLAGDGAAMGRPACAMIPAVLGGPAGVTSLGCIGNRVYTGLGDDELYFTIPGPRIGEVVERLETVMRRQPGARDVPRGAPGERLGSPRAAGDRAIISPP